MSTPFPIEPGYGRHIAPIVDEPDHAEPDGDEALIDETTPVEERADGSAVVVLDDDEDEESDTEFDANLAEKLVPETTLAGLSTDLLDCIERDERSRARRDEQYAEGIKRTGLGKEAPGGADFEGASRTVHPALVEGCIDYAARAIKELFPANGPCKVQIIGEATKAKLEKAERKKTYMNWQLTTQITEYRSELEQTLSQVPLGGSQYMKCWYDERFERPRTEFVPIDNVFLPFSASDFCTAERVTHRQHVVRMEFENRVNSGLYRDIKLSVSDTPMITNVSAAEQATDKIEGKEDESYNEDGERTIYEIYVYLKLEEDKLVPEDEYAPYIITIDESSSRVLNLRRNWAEEDKKRLKLDWMVEFGFVPWRGAYKIGLAHIIGGLSGATTGALRALLDSAHINNTPAGLKLKGARVAGQNVKVSPTELSEIEGPANIDDIRKVAMPFPFNPPSTVLFTLLQWLVDQAKGVVGTAEEKIADVSSTAPVGTTLAMIEQGSITYSSIHARLHESQKRMLAIIHRINGVYLNDETTVEELGDLIVRRDDFTGPMDVVPVSDPNIFSDTQRYAQQQAVDQLAANPVFAPMFKAQELLKRTLALLKYPDYEGVLAIPGDPKQLDAIAENAEAGKSEVALKAYPEQDHLAHLQAHAHFLVSPIFCANPMMAVPAMPKLLEHCKEHLIAYYSQHMLAATQAVQEGGMAAAAEKAQAEASQVADREMAQELGQVMQALSMAQQQLQQFLPKPPQDNSVQVKQMEIQARAAEGEKDRQFKAQEAQTQRQFEQDQATQEQSASNARHDEEMAVARENAAIAERSEASTTKFNMMSLHLKETLVNEREAARAQAAKDLEALRAENARAAEAQRAQNAEVLAIINGLLKGAGQERAQVAAESTASGDTAATLAGQLETVTLPVPDEKVTAPGGTA